MPDDPIVYAFDTKDQYLEAWRYLTSVGVGFTYNLESLTIEPLLYGEEDDHMTIDCLEQIMYS